MSQFRSSNNIYFNANFVNKEEEFARGEYIADRDTVVIQDPEKYFLTVEKVYINTELLPLVKIYDILPDGTKEFKLLFTIRNKTTNAEATVPINNIIGNVRFGSPVYENYFDEVGQFLLCFAEAIRGVWPTLGFADQPPKIQLDPASGIISIIAASPQYQPPPNQIPLGWDMWFNEELYTILSSFSFLITRESQEKYALLLKGIINAESFLEDGIPPTIPYRAIRISQLYPSLYLLDQVERFILSTSMIPIYKEYITSLDPNKDSSRAVLVSFETDSKKRFSDNAFIYELGDRKLIDFRSETPLRTIEYKIELEMADGDILPYYVSRGNSFGVTFGFRDKHLYLEAATSRHHR